MKSLKDLQRLARMSFPALLERYMIVEKDSNSLDNVLSGLDTFAETAFKAGIEAARGVKPKQIPYPEDEYESGFDACYTEWDKNIEALLSDKEVEV